MLKIIFRRQAYYIASAAFVLLSFVYFVAIINQPYVGLDLTNVNGKWIVVDSDPHGEGYKLRVRVGDSILKINNRETGEYHLVQKWSEAEGASTIDFCKIGQSVDTLIKIPYRPVLVMVLSEIPMVILGLVFLALGFFTWLKRPFMIQARALYWSNWFVGLAIALTPASSRDLIFARELEYIILSLVPLFLINLFSVFPSKKENLLYRFGRLVSVFVASVIIILTGLQSIGIVDVNGPLKKLVLVNLILGILLVLWNLGSIITVRNDKQEKNQANIVLLGMAIGFLPFILLTGVPAIFNIQPIMNTEISYLFISVVPATLYYVIVRKYLPDSKQLVRMTITFFVAGLITSIVAAKVIFFFKGVKNLSIEIYLSSLFLTMLFMAFFSLIRVALNKLLLKFIFSGEEQLLYRKVLKLSESLSLINEEDQILEEVVKSLAIEGLYIIVEDNKGVFLEKAVGRFLVSPSEQGELEKFLQRIQRKEIEAKILSDNFPAEIYISIAVNDFTCKIFLGHRYSHLRFEQKELPLMMLISSQISQRLITTLSIKKMSKEIKGLSQRAIEAQRKTLGLQKITASLFRSFEKEKKLIACDIHDGALQLGLDLKRWLKYLVEECLNYDNAKTNKAVSHMQELVENLNFELRLICSDLRPPSLTTLGLLPAIELMCEETMQKELLLISLETVGISPEDRFKEDLELAVYRFLQEGINNAVKHSGTDKLNIYLDLDESKIELTVSDSGKGFDTSKIEDWMLTSVHFGIVGMKQRLEGLGGMVQITSSIGQGTMLKAIIPIT